MMQEPERRQEARAVPEEQMGATVTPMARGAAAPAWYSRLSWGAIFAGVFIALATQLVIAAFVTWIGLAIVNVTDVAGLQDALASIGIWIAVGALVALFVGAWAAARIQAVPYTSDGLWLGATVWAVTLTLGILLSSFGVTGLLGFGANLAAFVQQALPTVQITPQDIQAFTDATASAAGWFLLGSLLALGASLLGGWLGSGRQTRPGGAAAMYERRAA